MDWKKKLYVLGVVLLCTSVLAAVASASNPNQHAKKAAISAVPQPGTAAQLKDATGSYDPIVITRTAVIPPEVRPAADSVQSSREKAVAEIGKEIPDDESTLAVSIAPVAAAPEAGQLEPRDGDPRAWCSDFITGTSTGNTYQYPVNGYYNRSRTVSIIPRTELTCVPYDNIITKLSVNIATAAAMNLTNLNIYMKKVTATTAPTTWDITGATLVYGPTTISFNATGWKLIDITDFTWDADNLQIMWEWMGTYSSTRPYYYYTAATGLQSHGYNDTVWPPTLTVVNTRVQYNLSFNPAPVGSCCVGYTCTENISAADCATAGGVYNGDGSSCTPNPCQAACCYNYPAVICADNSQAECTALGGQWHLGSACGSYSCPPWNDNCSAVTPVALSAGVPVTFTGTNISSTNDCAAFAGGQVWVAFNIPPGEVDAVNDVKLDLCGSVNTSTGGPFGNAWLNLATACPCATNTAAGTWNTTDCADANITIRWAGLAAGNYWYPVILDTVNNAAGTYQITVSYLPGYCASNATSTADETIANFTMGSINNTTVNCDTYDNFTAQSTVGVQGSTIPFSLTIGDCENASCYSKMARIFVDWNHDYDFVDAGETVWTSAQLTSTPCPDVTVTGTIAVPAGATLGAARLRIVVVEGTGPVITPCGTYTWGATEDYTLIVIEPVGACCIAEACTQTTPSACAGNWQGAGTLCDPNPCQLPTGACCFADGTCAQLKEPICTSQGGVSWTEGAPCDPNPCPQPLVACCYTTGACNMLTAADCTADGGTPGAYPSTCTPNTCPQPGDECSNPASILTLPSSVVFNNDTALPGTPSCSTYYTITQNDWWFKYEATADLCLNYFVTDAVGAGYDMVMGVYTGPDCANLTNFICLDDPEPYNGTFNTVAGTTYWFQIGDYGSGEGGGLTQFDLYTCPFGACCISGVCSQMFQTACTAAGGQFKGDGVACDEQICLTAACCFQPANNCLDLLEADCLGQGGTWFAGQSCATFVCPTDGDTCLAPIVVNIPAQMPYTDPAQHTCGRVNDYANTCLGYYDGGEDIIYQLVVTEAVCLNLTATGVDSTQNWIGIGIDSVCPLGATCIKAAGSSSNVVTLTNVALPPGTFYVMVDTWPAPDCLTNFTLTITAGTGCPSGACCLAGTGTLGCSVMFKDACIAAGGSFGGNGSVCTGLDCDLDGFDDLCNLLAGAPDCNANGIPDVCDFDSGFSHDWDANGIPDDCQPDCNANLYPDFCDLPGGCAIGGCSADPFCGLSLDCQPDGIPDECQLGGGGGGGGTSGPVYDAGACDGVNGTRPTVGWDDTGLVDGFAVPQGANGLTFNKVHVDILDFAQTDMPAMRVRMYALPTGSILTDLASFAASVAIFDHTYTVASGELAITTRAECYVGAGAWNYDGTGPAYTFTAGNYAIFVNFPGTAAVNYWASAADDGLGFGYVWGAQVDAPSDAGMALAWNISGGGGGGGGGDCNGNGIPDDCDIAAGAADCNLNGIPDSCELAEHDCNANSIPDDCDIATGESQDCNANNIPDECDIQNGTSQDCNGNLNPDECDIASGLSLDCNLNEIPDECDVGEFGNSADCNHNGIPDECELGTQAGGQILVDGGFEAGVSNPYWAATSSNFGTPLCDAASCGTGGGTSGAHAGLIWAWFGGAGATGILPEVGTLSQAVVIPSGPAATLSFYFWIGSSGGAGADTFTATVDGNTIFAVVDTDTGYPSYTLVSIPLAASYSDGLSHTIEFTGIQTTGTSTNFNLDDVALDVPGGQATNDCNGNGIPDICDIQVAFGGFCVGTYPPCDTDYNHNGVPDHCEICGDFTGSMVPPHVPDGLVNNNDYWYIHDGLGVCVGDPKYTEHSLADLDGDGCITLVDYRSWLMCYRMQNGKVFVPPTKRPIVAIPTKPLLDNGMGSMSITPPKGVR